MGKEKMKYLFIIFGVLFAFTIKSYCNDSTELSVNIKLLKEYFVPYNPSSQFPLHYVPAKKEPLKEKTFEIEISLKNNSNHTISIWLMSCSWHENFLINNIYIHFQPWICNKNIPTLKEIKAGDSLILKTNLMREIMWDNPCENCIGQISNVEVTKLGLIYISRQQCSNFSEYNNVIQDKSAWHKIIWSNPLYLNK